MQAASPTSSTGNGELLIPANGNRVNCKERTGKKDIAVGVFIRKKRNFDRYTPQELLMLLGAFNIHPQDLPRNEGTTKRIIRLWYMLKDQVDAYVDEVELELAEERKRQKDPTLCFKFPTIRGELVHTLEYKKQVPYRKMLTVGLGGLFGLGVILAAQKYNSR
jgi:hypothetical protein